MKRFIQLTGLALMLGACAAKRPPVETVLVASEPGPEWRNLVSDADGALLDRMPEVWRAALQAVPLRQKRLVEREGELLMPDAAKRQPAPPPGSYHCRLVKLGAAIGREPPVKGFPPFFCNVRAEDGGKLSFTKQTGTELPGGWLHEDGDRRLVFAGANQSAPGDNSLAYGTEPARDLVGTVERISPFRWRLVLPWRDARTGLDIYELTPVPLAQQAPEPDI